MYSSNPIFRERNFSIDHLVFKRNNNHHKNFFTQHKEVISSEEHKLLKMIDSKEDTLGDKK